MVAVPERPKYGHRIWPPKEGYDLVASVYDQWYWRPFWLQNEIPHIERLAQTVEGARLALDLGCGTGTYCAVLEHICDVVGVDPSAEMLRAARKHISAKTHLVCGSASAIPLGNAEVDISVAARSLCHEQDLAGAFRELGRVTRRSGVCIVSEVHPQHDYPRTRIPLGAEDVHIETFKRTPQEIIDTATSEGAWEVEHQSEVRWRDLNWEPADPRFSRIDRTSHRAIFFVIGLRRR
ncbi:MAG: class I SAM-dependent methyltransferase [Gammaproteobacteria bacterium]